MYKVNPVGNRKEGVETENLKFANSMAKEHSKKASCRMEVREQRGKRWYRIAEYDGGKLV